MRDEDLLVGFTEEEKQALREVRQLAETGDIAGAVRKASEIFRDEQGISVALRVGVITPAVRRGMPFEEVCDKAQEAIRNIEEPQQRSRFETALKAYREMVSELKQAVEAVVGIWADHPEFEGKGVREWRWSLWNTRSKDGV